MAALALVPFAPLLALPPRLVAAAASCACLLGGAALGVARVRAGEPRVAEVATATFAAVGATLAVSAWWLLASGGVETVKGSGGGDEREKGKWSKRKEAVRGAVNGGSNGTGASSSPSSSSLKQQRPLALAARFASVPWKAAQRASRAGNALCPFTGGFIFRGSERRKGRGGNGCHLSFSSSHLERVPPRQQRKKTKTKQNITGERATLRCPCCRATVSKNAWHSGDRFSGLGLGGGALLWQPAEAALEQVKFCFLFSFQDEKAPSFILSLSTETLFSFPFFSRHAPKTTGRLPDGEQDQARYGPGPQGELSVR